MGEPLVDRLERGLDAGGQALDALARAQPADRRDALLSLLTVYDLHMAPLDQVGSWARWQHHPAIAGVKQRLEGWLVAGLDRRVGGGNGAGGTGSPGGGAGGTGSPGGGAGGTGDPVVAIWSMANASCVPPVYEWLAQEASAAQIAEFVTLEGGPDGGFDDLVALCQLGLEGQPKLELARNYWDEMGRGALSALHTELHRGMSQALKLRPVVRHQMPVEGLERNALSGLLASNRWLQPEMVGALGTVELQAGPRCRRVVRGLRRVGASEPAMAFYEEHATADPRHGKDWLDGVVRPLGRDRGWATGMIRGARWRLAVNGAFVAHLTTRIAGGARRPAAAFRPEPAAAELLA